MWPCMAKKKKRLCICDSIRGLEPGKTILACPGAPSVTKDFLLEVKQRGPESERNRS